MERRFPLKKDEIQRPSENASWRLGAGMCRAEGRLLGERQRRAGRGHAEQQPSAHCKQTCVFSPGEPACPLRSGSRESLPCKGERREAGLKLPLCEIHFIL